MNEEAREDEFRIDDYRAGFEDKILRAYHLQGKERVFRIVKAMVYTGKFGKKPDIYLETADGKAIPKPLILNKTNAKTIANLHGNAPSGWAGKLITLYPTKTQLGRETVECIRVKDLEPEEPGQKEEA